MATQTGAHGAGEVCRRCGGGGSVSYLYKGTPTLPRLCPTCRGTGWHVYKHLPKKEQAR